MFWHQLALNVPLERLFTYSHSEVLPLGTRVVVTFRNKRHVAVVWAHTDELDFDANKVLPILEVLSDTPPLSDEWRAMMAFCSRYYLYRHMAFVAKRHHHARAQRQDFGMGIGEQAF